MFPNAHFTLYRDSSGSRTLNFTSPPLLLTEMLQIFGWEDCMQTRLCLCESYKNRMYFIDCCERNGQGSFSFKTLFFFSWFSNVFCLLNDSKNKMHSSHHFFLSISRQFIGSYLLNLAASQSSKCVPARLLSFLRFQPDIPPAWGQILGAFQ